MMSQLARRLLRHLWPIPALLVLLAGALGLHSKATPASQAQASSATALTGANLPDQYIAAIAVGDAQKAWEALCPELQARRSLLYLQAQLTSTRITAQLPGTQVTWEHIGTHDRVDRGEIRFYVITRIAAESAEQTAYIVWTQESGCVERIE